MEGISIRRNRMFSTERYRTQVKQAKPGSVSQTNASTKAAKAMGDAVTETLQRLMNTINQTAARSRSSGQLLQEGESTLAEVQENLGRMAELAREAASGRDTDRSSLQTELERLCDEIDRVLSRLSSGGSPLFQDKAAGDDVTQLYEDLADDLEALFRTVFDSTISDPSSSGGEPQSIPTWLKKGIGVAGTDRILHSLGLDKTATPKEIIAAISEQGLDSNPAAGRLAAIYLGAVIAGGGRLPATIDMSLAARGLQQLLAKLADGVSLDEAILDLTNGSFTSLLDFETQFTNGTAPGLEGFLATLLLNGDELGALLIPDASALAFDLLSGLGGLDLDLLMGAMTTLQSSGTTAANTDNLEGLQTQQFGEFEITGKDLSGMTYDAASGRLTVDGSADITITMPSGQPAQTAARPGEPLQASVQTQAVQLSSQSGQAAQTTQTQTAQPSSQSGQAAQTAQPQAAQLSSQSGQAAQTAQPQAVQPSSQSGTAAQAAQPSSQSGAAAQAAQPSSQSGTALQPKGTELLIKGSGTVTLKDVDAYRLTISSSNARVATSGKNVLEQVVLKKGADVTFEGRGNLNTREIKGNSSNTLVIKDGAVSVGGGKGSTGNINVWLEGAASFAANAANVRNPEGVGLKPFDLIWKVLLPGWSRVTAMSIDGMEARMSLFNRNISPDAARFWLDGAHGHPIHKFVIYGEDKTGKPKTRYAFLKWSGVAGGFEEVTMYPNPFDVSGGEEGVDWEYEEASHTLRLLTAEVTEVSGGVGLDAEQNIFSGRIALESNVGAVNLTLAGVDCRVKHGKAFDLARENNVTLIIKAGTQNFFESGRGCAGISLGDGSNLFIDESPQDPDADEELPAGTLTAAGGTGGAGIGRDSVGSWDRTSAITILGGIITATGSGSGAGIGAGKHGTMGNITIKGGTITASGGRLGGAGIGGAFGAPVRDITISGGTVTAKAVYHATAIGAGVQGECGDILITGTARILDTEGGDPGADIGACIFGKCGSIRVAEGVDLGGAQIKQWKSESIRLQIGSETVALPRFCLSSRALLLSRLDISNRDSAIAASGTINVASRRVSRIREAYNALCNQLEQNISRLGDAHKYISAVEESLVRDFGVAKELLIDTKQSIITKSGEAMKSQGGKDSEDVMRLII